MLTSSIRIVACALLVAISGCVSPVQSIAPDGFAEYRSKDTYRATSPDGVIYRVKKIKNQPFAELNFWKVALKNHMLKSGYLFLDESEIESDGQTGYIIELEAPVGNQDYRYFIALFANKKQLTIVEAAGEIAKMNLHRDNLIATISKAKLSVQ